MVASRTRVPLRWRVILMLVVLATLNVADTMLTRTEISHVADLERAEAGLVADARAARLLQSSRDNQVLALRAYGLTGDQQFVQDYRIARRNERFRSAILQRLLADQPAKRAYADQSMEEMDAWRRTLAAPLLAAAPDERAEVADQLVGAVGEPVFDRVRDAHFALLGELSVDQRAIRAAIQDARAELNVALVFTSSLTLALVAVFALALQRWITRPVSLLSGQLDRVARGELDTQIRGVGPVEFERIGENVDRMRRRIVDELRATTQAVEGLEQSAPVVSSMRDQLRAENGEELPDGLEVVARLEPAHGVLAGDWYDVLRLGEDRVALLVVDVSGHGPEAGLRALWLKHLLVPAMRMRLGPGEALNWVAGEIGDTGEWFATCVVIELDTTTGQCLYANAGHPPPLMFRRDGVLELGLTGPLFGPVPGQHWETGSTSFTTGDLLVVYTDGITEARNDAGEEFGDERLVSCLRSGPDDDLERLAEEVMDSVHLFGSERLDDDATLAVVTWRGSVLDR